MNTITRTTTVPVDTSRYSNYEKPVEQNTEEKENLQEITDLVSNGEILSDSKFYDLTTAARKYINRLKPDSEEQKTFSQLVDLAEEVHSNQIDSSDEGNLNQILQKFSVDSGSNENDLIDRTSGFEMFSSGSGITTGNKLLDSLSSFQMLILYSNTLLINMNNESAATLTVMQKLFEQVTTALSQLQSFLSQVNAMYKDALAIRNGKAADSEYAEDNPQGAASDGQATLVGWGRDNGMAAYIEKNGPYFPPPEGFVSDVLAQPNLIFFRADIVPDIVNKYSSQDAVSGYFPITPEIIDLVLKEVSGLISVLLPKDDASPDGQFYDLNKDNVLDSSRLETIITECTNKMKLISDLATKMDDKLRQIQNNIDSSKQQFDSAQSMIMQQINKI